MIKLFLTLILVTGVFAAGESVIISQPKSVLTSTALFSSLSNSSLTSSFLDCGDSDYKIWTLRATFTTIGKVDVCSSTDLGGTCSVAGSTASSTSLDTAVGDVVLLGFNLGTYHESETTNNTKFDGTFIAERNCVRKDFWK